VEIGPGRGALTRSLLPLTDELHAVELDRELADFLQREFSAEPKLHLHNADVLDTDLSQWGPASITGNLPYYITSPIIERFLRLGTEFPRATFLIQREVADRLRASPGTRDYGFLSVQTQMFCQVELICRVPPGAFSPPPKVDSAVVRLQRHAVADPDKLRVLQLASRCFAHKRKTLRNNLRPYYQADLLNSLPETQLRAEQLTMEQFTELERKLALHQGDNYRK
jgi:16S rRNA (adenine1518-N6/adenine1519-N6)-dimethyltransferase